MRCTNSAVLHGDWQANALLMSCLFVMYPIDNNRNQVSDSNYTEVSTHQPIVVKEDKDAILIRLLSMT